jgi:hypothetical protein
MASHWRPLELGLAITHIRDVIADLAGSYLFL